MRIKLTCKECGGNHFRLDSIDKDDAQITCQECGHIVGTLGEVKRQFEKALTSPVG